MTCRKCGAKLHERDRRPDGSYRCPACGAVLRPKQHKCERYREDEATVPSLPADLFDIEPDVPAIPESHDAPGMGDESQPEPDISVVLTADELNEEASTQPEADAQSYAQAAETHSSESHGGNTAEGLYVSVRVADSDKENQKTESISNERTGGYASNSVETDISELTGDALFEVGSSTHDTHSAPEKHNKKHKGKRRKGKKRRKRGRSVPAGLLLAMLILILVLLIMIMMLMRREHGDNSRTSVNAALTPAYTAGASTPSREPSPPQTPTSSPSPTPTTTPAPTPEPTPISIHFRAIGDVMMHQAQLDYANQGDGIYDFAPQFQFVKDALSAADYTIANLELTISTDGHYSGFPNFCAPESLLDALKDCGIDLFTTANNHILDGYFDGVVRTNDELDERGFAHVGSYRSPEEADTPLVVDIGGIQVGFLAYTASVNGNQRYVAADKSFCVKSLDNTNFKADVQALRALGAELVICLPHWGTENERTVSIECERYAMDMVDAGVDVILGSHPHMVQTMGMLEREVDGKQKNVLIAFSMGNFISNMQQRYRNNGIIVDFTVTRDPDGTISVHDPGYVPVYVYHRGREMAALCSLEYYDEQPDGMGHDDYIALCQSVNDVARLITQDGIARLVN